MVFPGAFSDYSFEPLVCNIEDTLPEWVGKNLPSSPRKKAGGEVSMAFHTESVKERDLPSFKVVIRLCALRENDSGVHLVPHVPYTSGPSSIPPRERILCWPGTCCSPCSSRYLPSSDFHALCLSHHTLTPILAHRCLRCYHTETFPITYMTWISDTSSSCIWHSGHAEHMNILFEA